MEFYSLVSGELSRNLTLRNSSSFSSIGRLFDITIRPHIFNIYGWVRTGQAITEIYQGDDAVELLQHYKQDTYRAIKSGFSANPIIHSFAQTARVYGIKRGLIEPFFASLTMDLKPPKRYTKQLQATYIHGTAEVIGLMCLRVATNSDQASYKHLCPGVEALAGAFKKVNLLRNFAPDFNRIDRSYFPDVSSRLTEAAKLKIINSIRHDFTHALPALHQLPKNSNMAVTVAARYYYALLERLDVTPASEITAHRIHMPEWRKAQIFATATANHTLHRTIY